MAEIPNGSEIQIKCKKWNHNSTREKHCEELLYNLKLGKAYLTIKQNPKTMEEKIDTFNCINVKSGMTKYHRQK